MWCLLQIAIMTLIIGSNGAYHWAGDNSGFAVPCLQLSLKEKIQPVSTADDT